MSLKAGVKMSDGAIQYTQEQEAAITHRGSSILVSAAAGSGKTRVLVDRVLQRINHGDDIGEFLIITYTKAAAAELREKICEAMEKEIARAHEKKHSSKRMRRQLMLTRGASIGTIHSFCTELLRESAHLLGLSPDFRVADESEGDMIKEEALEIVLDRAYEQNGANSPFSDLVDLVSPGRDDKKLGEIILATHATLQSNPNPTKWSQEQKEALEISDIADVSQSIWGEYLLSKASKTAKFWLEEMTILRVQASTYPDFEKAYANTLDKTILSLQSFIIESSKGWDKARACSDIEFSRPGNAKGYEELKEIRKRCKAAMKKVTEIFAYSSQDLIEDMSTVAPSMIVLLDLILAFDEEYAKEKRKRLVVDFSDLEHLTLKLLFDESSGEKTAFAKSVSRRFKEILVDEYQDVNAVQERIFSAVSQNDNNIFMVGDVRQSIYRFRLADPGIFLEKYNRFSEVDYDGETASDESVKILLSKNFRSTVGILNAANFVFSNIMSKDFGEMDYTEREALVAGRNDATDNNAAAFFKILDMSSADFDDEEESPKKIEIEGRYIANQIKSLTDGSQTIPDGKGGFRSIEYGDIVILLRSIKGKAALYASQLNKLGIPVDMPGGEGFFESFEVSAVLSLLRVIDNPMQDIPLAATLMGPVYAFSADDLADIRVDSKSSDFYFALVSKSQANDELGRRCKAFLADIEAFRLIMPDMPSDRFIWHVYNKTGLLDIVGSKASGASRKENLITLAESARNFELSGYKGLFGFLTYIDGLIQRGTQPLKEGGSASAAKSQNAVSIMSIHKSKGLEFPVVFMADTTKRLNNADSQKPLVVHSELGLGPMCIDKGRRIEFTTIAKMAIQSKLTAEMKAEELRVMYVAMTRARERLYIIATYKDAEKELEKLSNLRASGASDKLLAGHLEGISGMAGWIIAALRNCQIGSECIELSIVDVSDLEESEQTALNEVNPYLEAVQEEKTASFQDIFIYPYAAASDLPSKLTVTGLKGLNADKEAQSLYSGKKILYNRPKFITEKAKLTGAEQGTALHMAMQYIDYTKCDSLASIEAQLQSLTEKSLITKVQADVIKPLKILEFFNSPLGKRLMASDAIHREFKFSLLYPAEHFFEGGGEEEILFQGVIDCYFEESGEITVVDFKTDYVPEGGIDDLVNEYAPQVNAYSDALTRITGKMVREKIIYFFHLNEAVNLS